MLTERVHKMDPTFVLLDTAVEYLDAQKKSAGKLGSERSICFVELKSMLDFAAGQGCTAYIPASYLSRFQ